MKDAIVTAIVTANAQYIARKSAKANLNKVGINPDLQKALEIVRAVPDGQWGAIKKLEVEARLLDGIKNATNTKKPMRILQALLFTVSGNGEFLKSSAKTFILEFCGLVIGGAKTRDALAFSATGKGNENTSSEIKIARARAIQKAFGIVSAQSEQTQNSVAFSAGGIADTLGIATKEKRTGMPVVNLDNKVAQALDAMISAMSDDKLNLIVAQSTGK